MQTIYPYKDLVEIGRGGMATVYRATAPNGNLVALKVLAVHLASDSTARKRFELESDLRLTHPHIVRVLDWGSIDDSLYIVMDYIVGESLDRRLAREGTLTPLELLPLLKDTAEALDYAHARNVIHRDVKPSNILIRTNKTALLGDFGVAKKAGLTAYTATAARVGSVFYMSPEQANGVPDLSPSSDIYSLGVTAYYALAGRHPFEADNEIAIARMHIDTKPKHVSDVNPAVPRTVGNVVMTALEKDPAKRFRSAGRFASEFEKAIHASSQPKAAFVWLKPVIIGASWLAAIIIGLYSMMRLLPAQPISPTETTTPSASLTVNMLDIDVGDTVTPTPTFTPSPSITIRPSSTPRPTRTKTPTPTASVTPRPTRTPTRVIRVPTATRRPSTPRPPRPTSTIIVPSPTVASRTPTVVVATPTGAHSTPTMTPSVTPHPTSSATVTTSATPTPSGVPSHTPSPSPTPTPISSPVARVPKSTSTPTPTSIIRTPSASRTPTTTVTRTPTATPK